ncbi:MAG: hypothetical protein HYV02_06675 [Deltaproteobacteria bacterium]|nr:hypothetical protein [Deltaproteobacteria bacterium]
MDETDNGAYSRAPEVEDLVKLCAALNAADVRYVLIGGFAVILHGAVRGTKDIDLLVDASSDNVHAIKRAMSALPDNAVAAVADTDIQHYQVVRVADEIVVDLMACACGIDYAQALMDGIETVTIENVSIPIASKPLLIKMKNTFRDSDKSDVSWLTMLLKEEQHGGK